MGTGDFVGWRQSRRFGAEVVVASFSILGSAESHSWVAGGCGVTGGRARRFYERHHFTAVGDAFELPHTGSHFPFVLMVEHG